MSLPPDLAARLTTAVGPFDTAHPLPGAGQSDVWRVTLRNAPPVVLKRTHDRIAFQRELTAYREWSPAIGPWLAPLRAVVDDAIVLDWVDGRPADAPDLGEHTRTWAHTEAGRFRHALSQLPFVDDDPLPLPAAIAARCTRLAERAAGLVPRATVQATLAGIEPRAFEAARRVPCHRDFAPRNWIVAEHPRRLVVLDFALSRPDPWLVDLVELWAGAWSRHPDTRAAFFRGLGRDLLPDEHAQLHQLTLLHGLTTAVWGREHDAPAFAAHGDAILARLLEA